MFRYSFHARAAEEYANSYAWYARRSERIAQEFEREIERGVRLVAQNPESWPKYDQKLRRFLVRRFPFSIVYQILDEHIFIIAVAHSSRRPDYWKDRLLKD